VLLQQGLALGVVFAGDLVVVPRSTVGLHHDCCSGQRKSGISRRPASRRGLFTSGRVNPLSRIRSKTMSSSSVRVGAGPVARMRFRFRAPLRAKPPKCAHELWDIHQT